MHFEFSLDWRYGGQSEAAWKFCPSSIRAL